MVKKERETTILKKTKEAVELTNRFLNATDQPSRDLIYQEALQKMNQHLHNIESVRNLKISSGRKWDTYDMTLGILRQHFKIEKLTGDAYHTGKHPKANLIRDTPINFLKKCFN